MTDHEDQAAGYAVAALLVVTILVVTVFFLSDCYHDDVCRVLRIFC